MKKIYPGDKIARARLEREYGFLTDIEHPNLVRAYDCFQWEGDILGMKSTIHFYF